MLHEELLKSMLSLLSEKYPNKEITVSFRMNVKSNINGTYYFCLNDGYHEVFDNIQDVYTLIQEILKSDVITVRKQRQAQRLRDKAEKIEKSISNENI